MFVSAAAAEHFFAARAEACRAGVAALLGDRPGYHARAACGRRARVRHRRAAGGRCAIRLRGLVGARATAGPTRQPRADRARRRCGRAGHRPRLAGAPGRGGRWRRRDAGGLPAPAAELSTRPSGAARAAKACSGAAAWLFSSSEAIGNLCRALPDTPWHAARALATHPRIAQAAEAAGFGAVHTSAPTVAALVASIEFSG